ncbi:MAG TPA: hypothetical protein VFA74_10295 [Terriglobales bacterium]|nr:hypothetical protein [Terriglobales bacterium]
MKKILLFLVTASLVVFFLRCSKVNPTAQKQPTAQAPSPAAQPLEQKDEPEKPEIKAATPEDPGPIVTLVGPLAELAKNQQSESKQPELAKPEKFVSREPQKIDHIALSTSSKPQHFLHSVFPVTTTAQFAFEVPAHTLNPRLNGSFRSYTTRGDPDAICDKTADIDVMLLNDQEYNNFRHGRLGETTYDLEASHNQSIGWRVPSTLENSQKYHLVFSNSSGEIKTKFVQADFTISFE